MTSLGMMLAGSSIGQGTANFVHQQTQGDLDRERLAGAQADNAFRQDQMGRTLQQQSIEDQTVGGETDEDRLNKLAEIAGKGGRGDLQRKYQAQAKEARQALQMNGIANASRAITLGQFGPAAQMLNKTGLFGDIHSIDLADDVEQDPRNPTYSVYTAEGTDPATGQPARGRPVHVNQQMLYQLQAKPGDALHWLAYAQAQGQKAEGADKDRDLRAKRLEETERHNKAMEAARKAGGAAGASGGRLTDQRWRYEWAKGQVGKPGGFTSEQEAMNWATDPQKNSREYWASLRLAGGLQNNGAIFTDPKTGQSNSKEVLDGLTALARELRGSPIAATPAAPAAPPPPAQQKTAVPTLESMGAKPVPGKPGVFSDTKGRHFQQKGDRIEQWSPSQKKWVDVTEAITGAR